MSRKGKKRGRAGPISPTSGRSGGKKNASRAATLADELKQGLALQQRGLIPEAKSLYENYLRRHPADGDALHLLGLLNFQAQNFEEAVALLGRAATRLRKNPACFNTLGAAIQRLGRAADAIEQYSTALRIKPDYADALTNRGLALRSLNRNAEAVADFERLARINPNDADTWVHRGKALAALGDDFKALESFEKGIVCNAKSAAAHLGRANVLAELDRYEAAAESYDIALALNPGLEYARGMAMLARMYICDWAGFDDRLRDLADALGRGENACYPGILLGLIDDPVLQRRITDAYCEALPEHLDHTPLKLNQQRLRIAYFSADFNDHATSRLLVELIERHDRERFEVLGFGFVPQDKNPMSKRMAAAFDRFFEVHEKSDTEVVQLSRSLGVDIAVDLKGLTARSRPRLFAMGCAPVQVAYLGYPGTFAARRIDYIVADSVVVPAGSEDGFTEKVVRLPRCYQPNDSKRAPVSDIAERSQHALPDDGVVFCNMNSPYKILPGVFSIWMEILNAVPTSVLWMLEGEPAACRNRRAAAEAAGIDPQRLIFAVKAEPQDHLSRLALADVMLDTWPYNAHTTGSDALWAGVPIITRTGRCFASRVGASLLTTLGMPELITETDDAYRSLAVSLGTDAARRSALREKLADLRTTTPLFRSAELVAYIEAAYRAIAERHNSGGQPSALAVDPDGVATFDDPA